ncbi:DUF4064 domain-containing protein [Candidatus Woesearchaeota archaeon]|nr:DUF4064 domain-containing protein [Candidatus Woesearchaeota archaeon]
MYIFKHRQKLQKKRIYSKAQMSIFWIIGLVMLIALVAGLFVYNDLRTSKIKEEAKNDLSSQAEEIEKFVNDCMRKEAFEGLKRLGQTGGYLEIPKIISFKGTGYWYLDEVNIQPILNQTQERLLEHISANVPKCVDDERIKELGFAVQKGAIKTTIEFGNADVTVKIEYPIRLEREKFTKEFSGFFNSFDIRYRAVFEAATEVNERLFDADFDIKNPLKKLDYLKSLEFDVSYKSPETDVMVFTVTDKKSILPTNELYTFSFAARLGTSDLKKFIDLQNNSATNPVFLPYTIYSVDKKAQLDISSGTTISLEGQPVKAISVEQTYPNEVTTKDVPVYKKNADIIQKQDIIYVIDNPVYTFEPSGILFNKHEKLTLYYEDEVKASKGVGILMGKNGFWVPIPSKHEPEQKRVFASILGFTEFTAVNCASQKLKTTIAEHFFEPSPPCFIFGALSIIAVLAAATIFITGLVTTGLGGFSFQAFSFTWQAGLETIAGAMGITGTTLSTVLGVLSIITFAGSILGSTTDVFYEKSPENCQTFYPVCDQNINIEKELKDGTGNCIPDSGARVAAGAPANVCAQVKKCDQLSKFFCKPCSVKCSAQFY